MRKGQNPNKDKVDGSNTFTHQVVVPVFIPNFEGYFKDSLKILSICLKSLIKTSHSNTFITVVANGCCQKVEEYLLEIYQKEEIQEIILTTNIGKYNSVVKGIAGHNMPLVTISDADVLFLDGWQKGTVRVFNNFRRAGMVGLIPQFLSYQNNCQNLVFDKFFSKKLQFKEIEDPAAMAEFYKSLGKEGTFPLSRTEYGLFLKNNKFSALVGSGHVVATYKGDLFKEGFSPYNNFKMGGGSMELLDELALKNNNYSLTTTKNFAYHMGNTFEDWMEQVFSELSSNPVEIPLLPVDFRERGTVRFLSIKKRFINFMFKRQKLRFLFLKSKGLAGSVVRDF